LVAQNVITHHPADTAHVDARTVSASAHSTAVTVKPPHATPVHARLISLTKDQAVDNCGKLSKGHGTCMPLPLGARL
jgi:hypothetical protein